MSKDWTRLKLLLVEVLGRIQRDKENLWRTGGRVVKRDDSEFGVRCEIPEDQVTLSVATVDAA